MIVRLTLHAQRATGYYHDIVKVESDGVLLTLHAWNWRRTAYLLLCDVAEIALQDDRL